MRGVRRQRAGGAPAGIASPSLRKERSISRPGIPTVLFWLAFGLSVAAVVANAVTVWTGRSDAAGRGMAGAYASLTLPFPIVGLAIYLLGRSAGAKVVAAVVAGGPLILVLEAAGRLAGLLRERATSASAVFREPGPRALAEAIESGWTERIRFLLGNVDVNAPGRDGESLLGFALRKRQVDAALELARHGADPMRGPKDAPNALRLAAQDPAFVEVLRALLEGGTSPDTVLPDDIDRPMPLLFTAMSTNAWPNVRVVLEAGAKLDILDVNGRTPLARAVLWRAWDVARSMVERGAADALEPAALEAMFSEVRPPEDETPEKAEYDRLLAALAERAIARPAGER